MSTGDIGLKSAKVSIKIEISKVITFANEVFGADELTIIATHQLVNK